jgi:type VI secretion system protein ImpC
LGDISEIDDLPVWIYQHDGESVAHPAGELLLKERAIARVCNSGVIPLVSVQDQPAVRMGGFHSVQGKPLAGRWNV